VWGKKPESFDDYVLREIQTGRFSLLAALDQYISRHPEVLLRITLDEPRTISMMRTRVALARQNEFYAPDMWQEPVKSELTKQLRLYETCVVMWDTASPEERAEIVRRL
jgi:hypothetical protein